MSIGRARRRNRRAQSGSRSRGDENRFEQETRAFFARVREGYRTIALREPERMVVIDARGTPMQTHGRILEAVKRKLKVGRSQ
jgi:dTMP kinase